MGVPKPMHFAKSRIKKTVMKKLELMRKRNRGAAEMFDQPVQRMGELPVESCEMILGGQDPGGKTLLYWMGFIAGEIGGLFG
jgi:hypothetical protein